MTKVLCILCAGSVVHSHQTLHELFLLSHKIGIEKDVLDPNFYRLPHGCYGKTLFFRYRRNRLQQQGIDRPYAHYNFTHKRWEKWRSSFKWVVQVQPV